MRKILILTLFSLLSYLSLAQPTYTANDIIVPYAGHFRAGTNLGIYAPWTDEQLGDIAAGNPALGVAGIGAKALRPALFGHFVEAYGYDFRVPTYEHYDQLGLKDNTLIVGFPPVDQQDPTQYCDGVQSELYANLYLDIWDNGQNGTPVNDENYFALYIYKLVENYKNYVRFWEIWNEPGFDFTGSHGWAPPGTPGNWWDNNPDPCDYKLHAPIFHFVRTLRISYEVIKTLDPDAYVTLSGVGFPSFLDAVLRNTDNPVNGSVTPQYPNGGGAYFDVLGYHAYPHFDGSLYYWDNSIQDFAYTRHSDGAAKGLVTAQQQYHEVLLRYGYNGLTRPKKMWIITECNVPRKAFGDFIGSDEAQRNFMPKAIVQCMKNNIVQLHVYKIGEDTGYDEAENEFDVMGLYEKLVGVTPYYPVPTQGGIAYHTASDELFGKRYDPIRTAAMALPAGVDGGAFKDPQGSYTYVLWAVTQTDRSEEASAAYSFPAALNLHKLVRRQWDYTESRTQSLINPTSIQLNGSPVYLSEAMFSSSQNSGCAPMSISFTNLSQQATLTPRWTFEGGFPAISNNSYPTVQYNEPGNFKVTFELLNLLGNVVLSQEDYILVEEVPQASFDSHVSGPHIFFTNNTGLNADSYLWDFGDGTTSDEPAPSHVYYADGTYTVTLTTSNECGSSSSSATFTVKVPTTSKIAYTANDSMIPYEGLFRPGVNFGVYQGWSDEMLADISAGNPVNNTTGVGARSIRPILDEKFLEYWGYDIRVDAFQHYVNLDLQDNTLIVGFPSEEHQDPNYYCANQQSELFDNLYLDIWDNGENGTPVNDDNYYALYLYKTAQLYKDQVKFWEIWNEPSFDYGGHGWKPRGVAGNWWENNPNPCDYKLRAPIFHFVRLMRISYEIIKYVDPKDYVTLSGVAYSSFLDAVLRNTDNPQDGSPAPGYSQKGGAYFDVLGFHTYPHFDGSTSYYDVATGQTIYQRHSDAAVAGLVNLKNEYQDLLAIYGYDGQQYPEKQWIITESNLPRKEFGNYMGSSHAQRNYISKSIIECMRNDILQLHVYKISEEGEFNSAQSEFDLMGLYQNLDNVPMYSQQLNEIGVSFKTTSEMLYGTHYDAQRTAQLALPADVDGAAFRTANGKYIYALWAKTKYDQSEWAEATYSFPSAMGLQQVNRRDWNYSQSRTEVLIGTQNIELNATPLFLMETSGQIIPPLSIFNASTTHGCLPLEVTFTDASLRAERWEWSLPGATPSVSTEKNPLVVYHEAGTYTASLKTFNAAGEHEATYTSYIEVIDIPESGFSYTVNGTWVDFISDLDFDPTVFFFWYFGDGYSTGGLHPEHFYFNNGIYDVMLTATNECGSDTTVQTVYLTNIPTADFLPVIMTQCQPHRVRFLDFSSSSPESWEWHFPGGSPEFSAERNPVINFADAGTYEARLIVSNAYGADTLYKSFNLSGAVESNLRLLLCPGASITVNGTLYDENNPSGSELMTGGSVLGCDSIVHVSLSFDQASVLHIDENKCSGEVVLVNGTTYSEQNPAGTELIANGSSNGCDSIVHIDLRYFEPGESYVSGLYCAEDGVIVNGRIYNIVRPQGTEIISNGSANGCDSLIHIDLEFHTLAENTIDETWCPGEEVVINGTLYHEGNPMGTEVLTSASSLGCDSFVFVNLSFFPPVEKYINRTLCLGDQLIINGMIYDYNNPRGMEILSGGSANGCDSTIYIDLQFDDHIEMAFTVNICEGQGYQFGTENLTSSGVYVGAYQSVYGCDSIVSLTLNVAPLHEIILDVALCEGDLFNGLLYDGDTTLTQVLNNGAGCDTIISTNLIFYYPTEETVLVFLCEGDMYNGQSFSNDTFATFNLQSLAGCDSIIHADIQILDRYETYIADTIDTGEQYWVGNSSYDSTGIYTTTLLAENGCDSTIILNLTVSDLVATAQPTKTLALSVLAVPNPFAGSVQLRFRLPAAMLLTIDVMDVHGRQITRVADEKLFNRGAHHLQLDAADWPKGVYFCRFNAEGQTKVIKLVKAGAF